MCLRNSRKLRTFNFKRKNVYVCFLFMNFSVCFLSCLTLFLRVNSINISCFNDIFCSVDLFYWSLLVVILQGFSFSISIFLILVSIISLFF